jgi:hypothetical protein
VQISDRIELGHCRGSILIAVVVHLGAVKIYVAAVKAGAQEKRKDRMKLSLPPKLMVFLSEFHPLLKANCTFWQAFFFNLTLCMTKLRVLVLCFSYFTD